VLNLHLGEDVGNSRVWVRLGIEHGSSNGSSTDEEDRSDDNNGNSPCWQKWGDEEGSLLISVGEVVVSGVHVVEVSSAVHLDSSSVEVWAGSVELHAVENILVDVVGSGKEFSLVEASLLSQLSEVDSSVRISEQDGSTVGSDPSIRGWFGGGLGDHLNKVRSVSSVGSFSGISCWVGVASSPLEVNVISNSGVQPLGNKVVFGGWVGLDDVSSLSSDVQVEHSSNGADS